MNMLTIAHGNGRNEQSLVQFAKDANADSFSAQEAQMLLDEFRKIPRHRVTVAGEDWAEARNRAKSTLILTKSEHENLGELTRKVSERIPSALRVAPDRVLVCSMYAHPVAALAGAEGVAHFSLHPDAGPEALKGNDPKHPIVREYTEALVSTRTLMRSARQDGLLLVLTGDLQLRMEDRRQRWSPVNMLADPLRLGFAAEGLDWILFDRRLRKLGPMRLRKLHDHIGFVQSFGAVTRVGKR
jgi:hypothetical protein